jgi:hypothetical protein
MTNLWAETIRAAGDNLLRSPFPVRELILITDLRAEGYTEGLTAEANRLSNQGVRLKIVDVGGGALGNLAILDLLRPTGAVVPRLPSTFVAHVRNDGEAPYGPSTATVSAEGASRTIMIPRIESGATAEIPVEWRFEQAGTQVMTLELPPDCLLGDNRRSCSVHVRDALNLHLVDGDPSDQPFESETDFLQVAFTIGDIPWRVYAFNDSEWLSATPETADLLVIANVGHLTAERVAWLEDRVRRGMGLIIFPGEQVDVAEWDRLLYRSGEGLLPCSMGDNQAVTLKGVLIESVENSPLLALQAISPDALAEVQVSNFLELKISEVERPDTRVLARWNHDQASPAIVHRKFGNGQVVLMTTSADRAWSDWPVDPTWLLMIRELGMATVSPGLGGLNQEAGQRLTVDTGSRTITDATVKLPGVEESAGMKAVESAPFEHGVQWDVVRHAGIFEVSWTAEDGTLTRRSVAVNPVPGESNLLRIEDQELRRHLGTWTPEIVHHSALAELLKEKGREVWRFFATGLDPRRLELEITEAVLIADDDAALATLNQLRALGVHIALDDFGTGYSSLQYLQRFPFDKIKIDRSFVKEVTCNSSSASIIRAVVSIAADRSMITTAEGVETLQQRETVQHLGCTQMQGFLFSAARPAQEIRALLASGGVEVAA